MVDQSETRLALVVPCYNEERRLRAEPFVAFTRSQSDVRILFVDDGSRDRTIETLEHICQQGPSMELLRLERNRGKAEAVRAGFRTVFEKAPHYIGYLDADLFTPLETVSSFQRVMEEHPAVEMVFGSRVVLLGRDINHQPYRHFFGRGFAMLASAMLRLPVNDTQCGAKLFRNTETLRRIFDSPFESRWLFDIEILARLEILRARSGGTPPAKCVYEVPLERWHHVHGSKVGVGDLPRTAFDLGRIYLNLRAGRRAARVPAVNGARNHS